VEDDLNDALRTVQGSSSLRILKIIHGYGSSGKGGSTRTVARNWAYRHRSRVRAIIDGEDYTLLDATTQEMQRAVNAGDDPDLFRGNAGILVLWVR
jgi:hypothetical protein